MKQLILIVSLSLFMTNLSFSQKTNNNFEFDTEDFTNLFKEKGINVFKFPFNRTIGEYISISYEIYEYGKLIEKRNIIEDFQTENEIQFNHHHCRKDSLEFHRFYFFEEKDSLKMKQVLPGFSTFQKIDISKVGVADFNTRSHINSNLPEKKEIMFYYALYNDSDKMKKTDGWLPCPTGKSNNKLIESYDFIILFFAERINKDRARGVLGEDFYKNLTCPIPTNN